MASASATLIGVSLASAFSIAGAQQAPTEAKLCEQVSGISAATEQARVTSRSIIVAKSGSATAAYLNGCLVFGEGKPDKAADFFAVASSMEAKSLYFDWLGRAYGDQAQKASKIKQPFLARKTKIAFEKAVALDGDNLDARSYLAQFYQLAPGIMGGSETKARAEVQAIRSRSAYRGALAAAGYASRAGDLAGAAKEYEALTHSHPDSLAGWNGLTNMYVAQKQWSDAFRTAEAMRTHGRNALADYSVGRIAALSGEQLADGEAALRRYLTTTPAPNEPGIPSAHFRLAQILEAKKDVAAARTEYQEALKLQPGHVAARKALASLK